MKPTRLIIVAVGGQGNLLASKVLGEAALMADIPVRMSEIHGMAQRGGAVISHVRLAEKVASPLCEKGTADYLIAQEMLESLRWIDFLRPGGTVIISHQHWPPTSSPSASM